MKCTSRVRVICIALGCLTISVIVIVCGYKFLLGEPSMVKAYDSPDGRFSLELWENPQFSHLPGDSMSGSGYIVLKARNGSKINKVEIELVSSVKKVFWKEDRVDIVGVTTIALTEN